MLSEWPAQVTLTRKCRHPCGVLFVFPQKHDTLSAQALTSRRNKSLHKALTSVAGAGDADGGASALWSAEAEAAVKAEVAAVFAPRVEEVEARCEAALQAEEAKQQLLAKKKCKDLMDKLNNQYNQVRGSILARHVVLC